MTEWDIYYQQIHRSWGTPLTSHWILLFSICFFSSLDALILCLRMSNLELPKRLFSKSTNEFPNSYMHLGSLCMSLTQSYHLSSPSPSSLAQLAMDSPVLKRFLNRCHFTVLACNHIVWNGKNVRSTVNVNFRMFSWNRSEDMT